MPQGELLGHARGGGSSVFSVDTNLGTATVTLAGGMTRLQLLKALRGQLLALDSTAEIWIDSDLLVLFVLLDDDDGIYAIGAGSTDEGLRAVCKVMVTE
jgi:hypothetical protein